MSALPFSVISCFSLFRGKEQEKYVALSSIPAML
jgi:hypothetical protein